MDTTQTAREMPLNNIRRSRVPDHVASAKQVDLIVMATRGHTGLRRFLLGSVAEKVVRLAPCPVLVTRRPEDSGAD
jgi:nucleotide-binding universal stress UspA family protein